MQNKVSSGSPIGSNPLFNRAQTINDVLETAEAFHNSRRLGIPKANDSSGTIRLGKATADIPAATVDSDGNISPGTGEVILVDFNYLTQKYFQIETIPSGIVQNLSGAAVAGGDFSDPSTPVIKMLWRKGVLVIFDEACNMPYVVT